ncbi:hypothetical protein G6O67_001941 [Ophiocordyceps sinensis]|uniref:Aminoglycoside phosphotransferase domain-containing protein n=1 Tax=Ophiocordyceps sinensis TaxID=72228 RepID=A0A8H4PTG6_9HYPO|nr:hypothetical protein G6O67_001941 [Ophiocordyceps sinensis]
MSTPYVPPVDNTATQHDGTQHLAINDGLLRRFLTLVALKTTARFYAYDGLSATMRFVAFNTSIPVPRVHSSFVHKNRAYIVMERIQGLSLPFALKTLSESDLESIFEQLRRMMRELRALKPRQDQGIESCVGGSLHDSRIPRSRPRFGPFRTTQEFHLWLRDGLRPEEHGDRDNHDWADIKEMAAKQDGPWPPPVFTHGDLNPFNIMVRGDQVVGIIDWEFAGWYPYYWEYTSAWYGNRLRQSWQGMIDRFLEPCPEELRMEITRQKWWGDF